MKPLPLDSHITYERQYRHCGKACCHCKNTAGHGPYWYAFWRANGKLHSAYVGKELPAGVTPVKRSA